MDGETLSLEKVDLSELTKQVILNMQPKADKNEIKLEIAVETSVFVYVNNVLMSHAIANVLENAIKYSARAGHVKIELIAKHTEAVIKISDQGIGVDVSDLTRVQERFYRAKNSNTIKGSGLGLSICKEIIEKFNGHLTFESEVDVGTIVTIILPLM
jgi:signal transduction histidine kinase